MGKQPLPLVGHSRWQYFSFEMYPKKRACIQEAVESYLRSKGMEQVDLDSFFHRITRAIEWTFHNQAIGKTPRASVRKEIDGLWGVKSVAELKAKIPNAIRSWLYTKEISVQLSKNPPDLNRAILLLSKRAEKDFFGKGRDKDEIPVLLAADIAHALIKIGIKPVASRPTDSGKPSVFYQVVKVCFQIAGLAHIDPYEHMKNALKVQIVEEISE